jgi:hypothetical protein
LRSFHYFGAIHYSIPFNELPLTKDFPRVIFLANVGHLLLVKNADLNLNLAFDYEFKNKKSYCFLRDTQKEMNGGLKRA